MNLLPLNSENVYLFHEGTHFHSYQMLGAHFTEHVEVSGVRFVVWAPNASEVRVVGDFNKWQGQKHIMDRVKNSGLWVLFVPKMKEGDIYKYEIHTHDGKVLLKADPYGYLTELPPCTASVIYSLDGYYWQDEIWYESKNNQSIYEKPMLVYEVHIGSWRHKPDGSPLTYRELALELTEYVAEMGYTHIELMPVAEHPFDGSWGYQATGYYAVTGRYGTPKDFMYFVDCCHQRGIGVILDWVPGHFCKDIHGLRLFDGRPIYESDCVERSENWQWGTNNFDLGRPEVRSFLISNAVFWFDVFHIDGLRVDAVANILYLDYGRESDQWTPNCYGGNGNLEGMSFLRKLNETVFKYYPEALMIAEESTAWPMVSWPTYMGGLGFNFKWNMGWMNDMLRYMEIDPIHRKWHHNLVTFSFMYAYSENFILPLSHDEVVHGKKSLLDKMPGDYWQKFANLRVFYGYWMVHPGKKLLFMGGEFGHFIEWRYYDSLDWHLLEYDMHKKMHTYVRDLNYFYKRETSLWQIDYNWQGFAWIDCHDYNQSVITFMRKGKKAGDFLIIACNFTPVVCEEYRIGVPEYGEYQEVFNSDWEIYGGSGQKNTDNVIAEGIAWHNQIYSLKIKLPPLALICLRKLS